MSYLLHIETATDICSVALSDDDKLVALSETKNSLRHSEIITLQIEEVIGKAGIKRNEIAVVSLSEGPGSYTSLRVGMSSAKAICYALDIPLIGINTLQSLWKASAEEYKTVTQQESRNILYCPMIDARRMEVYASLYNNKETVFDNKPVILDQHTFDKYLLKDTKIIFSGDGSDKAKSLYQSEKFVFTGIVCSAKNLIKPAFEKYQNKEFADLAYFSPNYIKPPNITKPKPMVL